MNNAEADSPRPQDVARSARRLVFMSRGLPLAFTGVWLALTGVSQLIAVGLPAFKPFAPVFLAVSAIVAILTYIKIHKSQAASPCSVRAYREESPRERLALFLIITLGTLAVVGAAQTGLFDQAWIGPAFLGLMLCAGGGYFIYEAVRLKLSELALLGMLFVALFMVSLYMEAAKLSAAHFHVALNATLACSGLVTALIGVALHRRWSAWRTQVLEA